MADSFGFWPANVPLNSQVGGNLLLSRMQELKRWHEEQKQRLEERQKLQLKQLEKPNDCFVDLTNDTENQNPNQQGEGLRQSPPSQKTHQGKPHLESPPKPQPPLPTAESVSSDTRSFEEMVVQTLEQQKGQSGQSSDPSTTAKPKRPFLKRGEGLKRFNPRTFPQKKKTLPTTTSKEPNQKQAPLNAEKRRVVERPTRPTCLRLKPPIPSSPASLDGSFLSKMQELENKHQREQEELAEFERLETVVRTPPISPHKMSIPVSREDTPTKRVSEAAGVNLEPNPAGSMFSSEDLATNLDRLLESVQSRRQLLERKKKVIPYVALDIPSPLSDDADYLPPDFELPLEEPRPTAKRVTFREEVSWRTLSTEEDSFDSFDGPTVTDMVQQTDQMPEPSIITEDPIIVPDEVLGPPAQPSAEDRVHPAAEMTTEKILLRNRLKELEEEIRNFQLENEKLKQLQKKKDEALRILQKEQQDFEKFRQEAKAKLEAELAEERKQLKREKECFNRMKKMKSNQPNKQDKELFTSLRQQYEQLQEECKKQEVQHSTELRKLRSRLKLTEKERDSLKAELESLQSQRTELLTLLKEKQEALLKTKKRRPVLKDSECQGQPLPVRTQGCQTLPPPPAHLLVKHPACPPAASVPDQLPSAPSNNARAPSRSSVLMPSPEPFSTSNYKEIFSEDGVRERLYRNGEQEVVYSDKLVTQVVSADGSNISLTFQNGDQKQILPDLTEVYHFAESGTTCTTYPDGLKVIQFADGQVERVQPDGTKTITYQDGTLRTIYPDGSEESSTPDGTSIRVSPGGVQTLTFPNGEKEIRSKDYMQREFPDGSTKTIFSDGREESRYKNGRIRIKDKFGNVVLDLKPPPPS